MKLTRRKIICVDFDGVLHSYVQPWSGPRSIPDPPVDGALEWLAKMADEERFKIAIFSSRSKYFGGRRAMKRWLVKHYVELAMASGCPRWLAMMINRHSAMEPWDATARDLAKWIVKQISWPTRKPAAWLSIDDRAMRFKGIWPSPDEIVAFQPWNKRGI